MPASHLQTLRAMARNSQWANHRLLASCARLSQEAMEAPRIAFFPSLIATLNHILIVDRFYVDAFEGGTLGPAAWAERIPCPTIALLQPAQAAVDTRLVAWCDAMDAEAPDRIVEIHRVGRIQRERADRLLLHLFQHDIHHRGQAHAMLSGTDVAPPQLDDFFCVGEAGLRAGEFAELGWTEADVWPDDNPVPG